MTGLLDTMLLLFATLLAIGFGILFKKLVDKLEKNSKYKEPTKENLYIRYINTKNLMVVGILFINILVLLVLLFNNFVLIEFRGVNLSSDKFEVIFYIVYIVFTGIIISEYLSNKEVKNQIKELGFETELKPPLKIIDIMYIVYMVVLFTLLGVTVYLGIVKTLEIILFTPLILGAVLNLITVEYSKHKIKNTKLT